MSNETAYYARRGTLGGDLVTLLHPPYTLWHLAYVVIGAALAPDLDPVRLTGTVVAFAFGLGIGAHALDELHDRPLRTSLGDGTLWFLGVVGFGGAMAVAVAGIWVISPWVLAWAAAGVVLAAAYALEWSDVVHSDAGFALAWGSFPVVVGYWAQTESIGVAALVAAAAAAVVSSAQRALSTPARSVRRQPDRSPYVTPGGPSPELLLESWETPLRRLAYAVPLVALALLLTHL